MILQDRKGQYYSPNWEGIKQIVHSFAHAGGTYRSCQVAKDHNPYLGGDTVHAYVRFNKAGLQAHVLGQVPRLYFGEFFDPMLGGARDYRDLVKRLAELRARARDYNRKVQRDFFQEVDRINRHSFDAIDKQIARTKFVRDAGATALVVAAGVVSGGAAPALLATGAAIKGASKLTDAKQITTGVIGSAVVEVACEMTIGALGIGMGTATLGQKVIVAVFVQAPLEVGKTAVGGGDLRGGAAAGATEVAMTVVGHGVEKAIPVKAICKGSEARKELLDVGVGTAHGLATDYAKGKASDAASAPPSARNPRIVRSSANLKAFTGAYLHSRATDEAYVLQHCIVPHR